MLTAFFVESKLAPLFHFSGVLAPRSERQGSRRCYTRSMKTALLCLRLDSCEALVQLASALELIHEPSVFGKAMSEAVFVQTQLHVRNAVRLESVVSHAFTRRVTTSRAQRSGDPGAW